MVANKNKMVEGSRIINDKRISKASTRTVKSKQGFSLNSIKPCKKFVVERDGRIVVKAE